MLFTEWNWDDALAVRFEEGREEIVRNLKKIGVPLDQILQATGLSADEIVRL